MTSGERGTKMDSGEGEKRIIADPVESTARFSGATRETILSVSPDLNELFNLGLAGVNKSIQPVLTENIQLIRESTAIAGKAVEAYDGIGVSYKGASPEQIRAANSIMDGSINIDELKFWGELSNGVYAFDIAYSAISSDPIVDSAIQKGMEERRFKPSIKVEPGDDDDPGKILGLNELLESFDDNYRVSEVLDEVSQDFSEHTKLEMTNLTQRFVKLFLGIDEKYTLGNDKNHRKNLNHVMIKFFNSLRINYGLKKNKYDGFLLSMERGILSHVNSMLYLKDQGYDVTLPEVTDDRSFGIDFYASKIDQNTGEKINLTVQVKTRTRDKEKFEKTSSGKIIVVGDNILEAYNGNVGSVYEYARGYDDYYTSLSRREGTKKKMENMDRFHSSLNPDEHFMWMETDPYEYLPDDILIDEKRVPNVRK